MSVPPPGFRYAASNFLRMLLNQQSITPIAAAAFEQILLAERRDAAFAKGDFASDEGWRMLLVLFVARDGGYQLALDIFPMIRVADASATSRWMQLFLERGFVEHIEGGFELTEKAVETLSSVLDPNHTSRADTSAREAERQAPPSARNG